MKVPISKLEKFEILKNTKTDKTGKIAKPLF